MTQWHTPNRFKRAGLALALLSPFLFGGLAQAADNLEFTGALVEAACDLHAGDDDIELDFNTVIDRYLYRYGETPARPFTLRLDDCDNSVLTGVRLTFSGTESIELPGLLAFDPSSTAKGVAVALQTAGGQPLKINDTSGLLLALPSGDMTIPLQAYLKAEPTAVTSQSIVLGDFKATAYFALDYE
ncbi:fimbrial protein [Pseudomonas sp. 8O]|uniref:fimbrial protein n=1 Tax=Pseudomonas sp. 8O TaxID=2653165 RepID=UPI0012F0423D|nr:fimbrial protein [Pseudomonas sp. 8O]VXC36305.1 Pilin (Type 1 fimbria component protein) [Pseudomonas sp. 8O]